LALFNLIEKLNFRFYGTGIANRSDTGQGELFHFANTYYNQKGQKDEDDNEISDEWLKSKLIDFVKRHANDAKFVQYLTLDKNESGDYYTWPGLRFFLASYEEMLRNERKQSDKIVDDIMMKRDPEFYNDYYQREHIWATKEYTVLKDDQEKDVNKRRLANFIMLNTTANIRVSNDRVEHKIAEYVKDYENNPNTLMIRELKDFYDQAFAEAGNTRKYRTYKYWLELYTRMFDHREEKLVNFALNRWRINELSDNIKRIKIDSFTDKNEVYFAKL